MSVFTSMELRLIRAGLDYVFDIPSNEFEEIFGVDKEDYGYIGEKIMKMKIQAEKDEKENVM